MAQNLRLETPIKLFPESEMTQPLRKQPALATRRPAPAPAPVAAPSPAPPAGEAALGQRLRSLRAARHWTLGKASDATGLARSTLSKIENGLMSPTYDALTRLAAGFNIDVSELFSNGNERVAIGRRSVCRRGDGKVHATQCYEYALLCND